MAVLPTLDNLRALLQRVIFVPIVYGFISLLPMFLTGWENSDRLADRLFSTIRSKENMFDFIVVGGGTAGALVANRLAEHYKVLLLEAGGTPMPFQTIPALALKFLNHPQTDWSHKTQPQRRACLNSINQQSSWSSGRGLGGTTNINFMTHVRGHPMDYDSWAEQTGDPGWSYQGVLPYFKRCETFSGTSNDPEARGHTGELRIRKPSYVGLSEDWVRAGQEIGYPFVDLNGRHEEGFGILQYPIYKGIRQSTYASFLLPMHKSPRLTIRRYALVRKVLFRDMNNMAYGVEYVRHGRIETAIATKEVILSSGTLGTAKLLMLSGVGPRQHLEELGIPVRAELPVGMNLQDHLAVHLGPFFIKEPKSFLFDRDVTPENIVRWLFLGTGPITTTGYQGAASIASSFAKSQNNGNWPDLHLILHGQAIHQGYTDAFAYAYGLQEDELMQYYSNAIGQDSFHIYVVGSRPTSTGRVLLSGASINDPLVIDPRYLSDGGNQDFKVLMEGVKTALNIANTSMFQRLGTEFTSQKLPGCQEFELGTDPYWECYIRRFTITMQNPVGTASMNFVVDSNLKVRNTRGLRVVDASVQPTLVSTGTSASTLMIAEKGVDMILRDHGIPDRDQDLFDVIFGRNGFFKRNPILRILQREFDTINPLRALFKPFIAVASAASGERNVEDAKERFTRNGRLDNPLLQVISTVFGGNSNYNQRDKVSSLAAASDSVDVGVEGIGGAVGEVNGGKRVNESALLRREGLFAAEATSNVLSKNQWVLQQHSGGGNEKNVTLKIKKPSGLKIMEVQVAPKKKGGRRYALLQKILREEAERNATFGRFIPMRYTTTTIKPPPPPSSSSTTSLTAATSPITFGTPTMTTATTKLTPPAVVQVVQFEKPIIKTGSISENEIGEVTSESTTWIPTTSATTKNESSSDGGLQTLDQPLAKQVGVNSPSAFGVVPFVNSPSPSTLTTTSSPLTQLFKSLSTFEAFMNSLAEKDRDKPLVNLQSIFAPLAPKPVKAGDPNIFKVSPSQNQFHPFSSNGNAKSTNGNIFDFLNPSTTQSSSPTVGPFHFIFGGNNFLSTTTPTPNASPPQNVSSELADAVGFDAGLEGKGDNTNKTARNPSSENNIFSSWFKPLQTSSSSSWFKPFDKPLIQPASSWFKPLNFDKSSSWFKPLDSNGSKDNKKSSWFNPFDFNSLQKAAPSSSSTSSPPTSSDPFGDLFELVLGGLKKHERRAVFKTLGTMLQAGETFADLLGVRGGATDGGGIGGGSAKITSRSVNNFFQQISKGKRDIRNETGGGRVGAVALVSDILNDKLNSTDEDKENLLKSLIALNTVLSSHHNSTTTENPPTSGGTSTLTDSSLEEFLSTFDYPPPAPSTNSSFSATTTEMTPSPKSRST